MVEEAVLSIIRSSRGGILQSDIWKSMNIDSRKCSKIVIDLEQRGLIKRIWEKTRGSRTYRILYTGDKPRYKALMAEDKLAPCVGCARECAPELCLQIDEWVQKLVEIELKSNN